MFFLIFLQFLWNLVSLGRKVSTLNKLVAEVFVIEAAKKMFEKSPDHVVGTQTLL